jgi:hypothetical protein
MESWVVVENLEVMLSTDDVGPTQLLQIHLYEPHNRYFESFRKQNPVCRRNFKPLLLYILRRAAEV